MAFGDYNYKLEVYNIINNSKLCEFVRSDFIAGEVVWELNGEETLTFTIPRTHANFSQLAKFRVVRLVDTTIAGSYIVYRIKRIKQWRERKKLLAEIYCEHLKYDLADRYIGEEKHFVQENPQTVLDYILSFSDAFTRGECPETPLIDFDLSFQSCLEAVKELAEKLGYDYLVTTTASPNYKVVSIMTLGGDPVAISYGENIKSLKVEESVETDFATRVIAKGGPALVDQRKLDADTIGRIKPGVMTVAGAAFVVKSWTTPTYWLKVTSLNLLKADDALNGALAHINGDELIIIDSKKSEDGDEIRLEASPSEAPVAGDRVYFFKDGATPIDYVPDKALENDSSYMRIETLFNLDDLPDILNVAGPEGYSDLSGTYTGGICQGWTTINQISCTENTDTTYIRTGTKSQRAYCAGDGDGIKRSVDCGFGLVASFYIWIYISAIATGAKLKTRLKIGTGETDYFPQNADTGEDEAFVQTTGWHQIICEGGVLESAGSHDLEILAVDGSVTFYLDSVMVQLSEYITDEDNFYPWDTRVILWEKAVAELQNLTVPTKKIDLEIIDLYEADRVTYSTKQITPGTEVEITDAGLGLTGEPVRTKRKTWNLIRPWEVSLEVST